MSLFKQKLRKLLKDAIEYSDNISKNERSNDINFNDTINKLLYQKRQNKINSWTINVDSLPSRPILNSSHSSANFVKSNQKIYKDIFSLDKFKNEKCPNKVGLMMRSCTLKDIHNNVEVPSLNKSMSMTNVTWTTNERGSRIKNKIDLIKEHLTTDVRCRNEKGNKKRNGSIGRPVINLDQKLYSFKYQDVLQYTPRTVIKSRSIFRGKEKYISTPKKTIHNNKNKQNYFKAGTFKYTSNSSKVGNNYLKSYRNFISIDKILGKNKQ